MHKILQRQVHLDFHTSEYIENIGEKFNEEQFIACLKKGRVNSVTVFAKCHHGWSYYPSKVAPVHPHLKFDLLKAELDACKKAGIKSPVYISVGFDDAYYFKHPEHAIRRKRDDKTPKIKVKDGYTYADEDYCGFHWLCMNTPYLDEVLKQVKEVITLYNPEGLFFDIVGETVCYCDACVEKVKELGFDENDDNSFKKLAKITYENYCEKINSVAKKLNPNIKIFHNGGHIPCGKREYAYKNTHLEIESLPTGGWGYDHFPKSAIYAKNLGLDYLGMTGKFHNTWGEFGGFKHKNALKYEVALSLAFGAKCSVGDQMHPLGFLDDATYELIGNAYERAEKIEEYCYDINSICDIGVLSVEGFSQETLHRDGLNTDIGTTRVMLEGKYLFNILDIDCDFNQYKMLIVPDDILVSEKLIDKLKNFTKTGGKILASGKCGQALCGIFDLGCDFLGKCEYNPAYYLPTYNALELSPSHYVIYENAYQIKEKENAVVLGYNAVPYFNRDRYHYCSHKHTPFRLDKKTPAMVFGENGGYIAYDIFSEYAKNGSFIAKETAQKAIDTILKNGKTLKTNLLSGGVVTLNEQVEKNRLILHALYALPVKRGGLQTSVEVIEDTPPIYNTTFDILTDKKVKFVKLVPENKKVKFKLKDGKLSFTIDKIEIAKTVVIQYK